MFSSITATIRPRMSLSLAFLLAALLGCPSTAVWAQTQELEHHSNRKADDGSASDLPGAPAGTLIFANKVTPGFQTKIVEIAKNLGTDPNFLMAIMEFESGLNPAIQNKDSRATGLIQFTIGTAKGLGTTIEELKKMSAEEQLPYVAKYFASHKGHLQKIEDAYMAVIWPRAVGKPLDYVLFTKDDKDPRNYQWNKGLDANKDGKVTKFEAASPVRAAYARGLKGGAVTPKGGAVTPKGGAVTPKGGNSAIRPAPQHTELFKKRHQHLRERAKKGDVDVLFLGDSITQGWEGAGNKVWKKHFGTLKAANFGIGSDATQNVLWRVTEGKELEGIQPKVVVLLIGTNNIGSNRPAEIADGVIAIVNAISKQRPQTKFILMELFPRGAKATDPLRKKVNETNTAIEKSIKGTNISFLDVGPSFLDDNGNIRRDMMPDLVHLSERGYTVWAEAIHEQLQISLGNTGPSVKK